MSLLFIRHKQDLIFEPNNSVSKLNTKWGDLQNRFTFNHIKDEFVTDTKELNFIRSHFDLSLNTTLLTTQSSKIIIEQLATSEFSSIINLKAINDIRYLNKFFETVNVVLPDSGLYLGRVITFPHRKTVILKKYPPLINNIICLLDYAFSRVLPKLPVLKKLYFQLTKGKGRVLSKAETFGRLYSCGFEVIDEISVNNFLYFVAKKVKAPSFDTNPTYAPIIRLKRIGLNGKLFKVYKLRTMHPYSEYLQEYIYERNELQEGGKIKNDFRISAEGKVFRKFWIDELPMLLNIFKGEMKLVGVRPLSEHYYNLYDADLRKERVKYKPGFIPPFYVDLPKTFSEIMDSERKYLQRYKEAPVKTDIVYLFKALKNVLLKGARSA